jgi:spore coat protein H
MSRASHITETAIRSLSVAILVGAATAVAGCPKAGTNTGDEDSIVRPAGWTEATHGKHTAPNYDLLYAMDIVHQIQITIDPTTFAAMQENVIAIVNASSSAPTMPPPEAVTACSGLVAGDVCSLAIQGQTADGSCFAQQVDMLVCKPALGTGSSGAPPDFREAAAACVSQGENNPCSVNLGGQPVNGMCTSQSVDLIACRTAAAPGPGGGGGMSTTEDPMYVPVTLAHDGNVWEHVGMRYKGNSSMKSAVADGNGKLPFRLAFDKFEDTFPEINNQRFYGFKEMTFSSNSSDDSQIRECFTAEIFRDNGVPAARCAFYRIFVDVGQGAEYWGLYSAVEDPSDNAFLDSRFGGHDGNLYKPEGAGADWTHFDAAGFAKKTNEDAADWTDVEAALVALQADVTDAAAWRAGLERWLDVQSFLSWLAVNTVVHNWDAYGVGAHNYYLYGDPAAQGWLTWIPWDHNLAMMEPRAGSAHASGPQGPAAPANAVDEIFHTDAGPAWPLISKLLADEAYAAQYRDNVAAALGGVFETERAVARMRQLHDLISPYLVGPDGERPTHTTISSETAFTDAIDGTRGLAAYVAYRHTRVNEALANQ